MRHAISQPLIFHATGLTRIGAAGGQPLVARRGAPGGEPWEPLLPMSDDEKQQLYRRIDAFDLDFDALASVE